MDDLNRQEMNALLELIKRHAQAVSKEQLIEDINAMQSKLDTDEKTKAASANPEK